MKTENNEFLRPPDRGRGGNGQFRRLLWLNSLEQASVLYQVANNKKKKLLSGKKGKKPLQIRFPKKVALDKEHGKKMEKRGEGGGNRISSYKVLI